MFQLSRQKLLYLRRQILVSKVETGHNVRRQPVPLANLVLRGGDDVAGFGDLDLVVFADAIFRPEALPPVPVGVETLTVMSFEYGVLRHHLPTGSLASVMLTNVLVDPG